MQHADSKMMDRIAEIENCVLGGFVLDDRGNWVSIADKKTSEEDFLAHLEAGRVLHNGQWVSFTDAKLPAAETNAPLNAPADPVNEEEETAFHSSPSMESDAGLDPPETKVIQIQPRAPEPEETDTTDVSSYAMETGLFIVEHPLHESDTVRSAIKTPLQQSVTAERKTKRVPAYLPPSIPTWENEESRHKKRTLIIGGIAIAVAGIAAALTIGLQFFR